RCWKRSPQFSYRAPLNFCFRRFDPAKIQISRNLAQKQVRNYVPLPATAFSCLTVAFTSLAAFLAHVTDDIAQASWLLDLCTKLMHQTVYNETMLSSEVPWG